MNYIYYFEEQILANLLIYKILENAHFIVKILLSENERAKTHCAHCYVL